MAKKKGSQSTKARRAAGRGTPPVVKPEPASPGGPNRQARKDEARRQREALRRKMARRRTLRVVGALVAVLVIAAGVTSYVVLKPSAAAAAGCGSVQTVSPYRPASEDRTHIGGQGSPITTMPPLRSYPSPGDLGGAHFPTSGPHNPVPLGAGVYTTPPPLDRAIHSLEHASVEIWYNPAVHSSALTALLDFYRQAANNDHVIVAAFRYPSQGKAGIFPADKQMVMVAWHRLQACGKVSLGVAKSFVGSYRYSKLDPAAYKGVAPEIGQAI